MAENNLQKTNKHVGVLADVEKNIAEKEHEYSEILSSNKDSAPEKILASLCITRVFKYFPNLASQAVNVQLDLCKDKDICVRTRAIRDLSVLCAKTKGHVTRIANALCQLLFTDDPQELITVRGALLSLVKIDAKGALTGMFQRIHSNVEVVRERSMKFILDEVIVLGAEIIENDAEDLIISECKKVMRNVTCEEFQTLMMILSSTRRINTEDGHKELVELLASTAELEQYFNPDDTDQVNRLITCLDFAIPFFSARVESTKFVVYLCELLNRYTRIKDNYKQFIILKLLAESVSYCGKLIYPEKTIEQVYQAVLDLVTVSEKNDSTKIENVDLHRVEALLYVFHVLGKQCPYFLSEISERQKEFKRMFLYVGTFTLKFLTIVRRELNGKYVKNVKNDPIIKNKLKDLRTARNINTLIRQLFNVPPRFETTIDPLSWLDRDTGSIHASARVSNERKRRRVDVSSRTMIDRSDDSRRRRLKDGFGGESSNSTKRDNNMTDRGEGGSVRRNARRSFDKNNRRNSRSWQPY